MVQHLHQAGQEWPAGESMPARLVWGAHTPTDRTTVLAGVTAGYAAGVFSLETAVRILQEAGYPIEDVAEEIERIQKRAFDQAARLAAGVRGVVRGGAARWGCVSGDARVPGRPAGPGCRHCRGCSHSPTRRS